MKMSSTRNCSDDGEEPFRSIGNERVRFFDEGYFSSKRLKIKAKNSSGVEFSHESELFPKGNMFGYLSTAYKISNSVSLDKFCIKSDGRIALEAAMKLSDNTKLTVSAEDSRQEPGKPLHSFGKLGFLHNVPMFTLSADVDVVNGYQLKSSFITKINSLKIGSQVLCRARVDNPAAVYDGVTSTTAASVTTPQLIDFTFVSSYNGDGWCASAITRNCLKSLRISYIQALSPIVDVGAQIDYGLRVNTHKFNIGAKMVVDEKSSVKAKLNTDANFSLSFQQKLSNYASMTVCAEVDASDWSADSHKFGFGLSFE